MKSRFLNLMAFLTTHCYYYWTKVDSAWCRRQLKLMDDGVRECESMADVAADENDEERVRLWLGRAETEKRRRVKYYEDHPFVYDNVEQTPLGATGH